MTSKDRAVLRSAANGIDTVCYIGKDGIDDNVIRSADAAIKARELIKIKVQDGCMLSAKEAAYEMAEKLGAECVQVIGKRFVLYRRNKDIDAFGI